MLFGVDMYFAAAGNRIGYLREGTVRRLGFSFDNKALDDELPIADGE
jgi:hypothetical protein